MAKKVELDTLRNQVAASIHFARAARGDWAYCPDLKGWMQWTGRRWEDDQSGAIRHMVAEVLEDMMNDANEKEDKQQFGWLNKMMTFTNLGQIANLAMSELSVGIGEYDRAPMLFNVANGIIDLTSGELMPHDRDMKFRHLSDVVYDPDRDCPTWMSFIDTVSDGNEELANYLQRVVGYSLTGQTTEQCFFILHGPGANGKSVFLSTIRMLMGSYAATISSKTLLESSNNANQTYELAQLATTRYIETSETEVNSKMAEGLVKTVTGGEAISCRHPYGRPFSYVPRFKLFLATNHKPMIHGTDQGIWRRIKLIPFQHTIPAEKRDKNLLRKLANELPGILNWAVMGCQDWLSTNLDQPQVITDYTSSYQYEMDPVQQFIEECCKIGDIHRSKASTLHQEYRNWAERNGYRSMSHTSFGQIMGEKGYKKSRTKNGFYYEGIAADPFAHM